MSDDIIRQIDAAVCANLCGCGCGQQIPDNGPSLDFVDMRHQRVWQEQNMPSWIAAARAQAEARNGSDKTCDDTNCSCHLPARATDGYESYTAKPSFLRRALNRIRRTPK